MNERYRWQSFILFRRVIFTLSDILLVVLPSFKYMIFAFIHLSSLLVHVSMQPYVIQFNNRAELLMLTSLTSLSVMVATFPDERSIKEHTSISVAITICVMVPIIIVVVYALHMSMSKVRTWRQRLISHLSYNSDNSEPMIGDAHPSSHNNNDGDAPYPPIDDHEPHDHVKEDLGDEQLEQHNNPNQ
jgi:hypothetical protein